MPWGGQGGGEAGQQLRTGSDETGASGEGQGCPFGLHLGPVPAQQAEGKTARITGDHNLFSTYYVAGNGLSHPLYFILLPINTRTILQVGKLKLKAVK